MKKLMTYYGRDLESRVRVIQHGWAPNVVVLQLFKAKKILCFRFWKFIECKGIDWPENQGALKTEVNKLFDKYNFS